MIPLARPIIGAKERAAVDRVLASGMIAQGPEVDAFETEFSALVANRHCVAVNSGTSALHLGMLAAGIGPGDEVIVPSFTFAASANAIRLCGAEPVFVDIDLDTYCISPDAVAEAVTKSTAAIMAVHLYGHPADMAALRTIADRNGLLLIEDAAQAHGAVLNGQPVGALGDIAAFSFYPTKNMTTGEGGMIVTADDGMLRTMKMLRNQGMERRYHNEIVGFNNRMTDIAAAIGRVQLDRLPAFNDTRRANAAFLSERIFGVSTPVEVPGARHVFHQYTIRAENREDLRRGCDVAGVQTDVYYPVPVHRLPIFDLDLDLPNTSIASEQVVSVPVWPGVGPTALEQVAAAVNATTSTAQADEEQPS